MIQALRRRIFDRLVLRPSRQPVDSGAQERVTMQWGRRSETLECFVQRFGDAEADLDLLVVKFPGTAGRAERSTAFPASHFEDVSSEVWTWNPPGYGGSEGRASLNRIAEASLAFWQNVTSGNRVTDSTRIWIAGNSLGCATALNVGAAVGRQPRLAMMLRNPPPLADVVKHIAKSYPLGRLIYPVADSLQPEMNAVTTAASVELPAVFFQSELDELVLPEMQQRVFDAYRGPKRFELLTGLTHGGIATEEHQGQINDAIAWLWEQTHDGE